jgi:hypothetical protein
VTPGSATLNTPNPSSVDRDDARHGEGRFRLSDVIGEVMLVATALLMLAIVEAVTILGQT